MRNIGRGSWAIPLLLVSWVSLEAADRPKVHVVATGGTIAGGTSGSLTADEIAELAPGIAELAKLSFEDFSAIGSSRMTPALQFQLAQRIKQILEERVGLSGIVVTHGTDSLEETAFLLDLLLPAGRPVVLTAALRPPRLSDSDGPRNLLNAVRLATTEELQGLGVLVTMSDEIHAAREVRKTDSIAFDAFASPESGPLGRIDAGKVFLFQRPARRLGLETDRVEPRVELLRLFAGMDGRSIRQAVEAGARGIVLEVFGRGSAPPTVMEAVRDARSAGVIVVFSTRTGRGRVELGREASRLGVISAEDLDGLKARMVLVAALGKTTDLEQLSSYYRRLAGEIPP